MSQYYDLNKNKSIIESGSDFENYLDGMKLDPEFVPNNDYYNRKVIELMKSPKLVKYVKSLKTATSENRHKIINKQYDKIVRMYNRITYFEDENKDLIDSSQSQFPSSSFKRDPRFDRMEKKQLRESEAMAQRHSYGLMAGYDMFRNGSTFASAFGSDTITPKQSRPHQQKMFQHDNDFNNINKHVVRPPRNPMDPRNPTRISHSDVNKVHHDIDVDTYVRFGTTPSRGAKSIGYPNPADHYFNFIDDSFQHPDNVVNSRGVDARAANKKSARQ